MLWQEIWDIWCQASGGLVAGFLCEQVLRRLMSGRRR